MHDTAFTWQGVSHALLHQKSFITQLQGAGSVPREPGFWGPGLCMPSKPQHPSAPKLLQGLAALQHCKAKCTREQQGPWISIWQHKTILYD